jgi:hypothetical protein
VTSGALCQVEQDAVKSDWEFGEADGGVREPAIESGWGPHHVDEIMVDRTPRFRVSLMEISGNAESLRNCQPEWRAKYCEPGQIVI